MARRPDPRAAQRRGAPTRPVPPPRPSRPQRPVPLHRNQVRRGKR